MTPEERHRHYQDLCRTCGGGCCRHIALQIDTPDSEDDFDTLRWFLLHRGVKVFIDHDDSWNLEVATDCTALTDGRCAIYDRRPRICRDYPPADDACEHEEPGTSYKVLFRTAEDLEAWRRNNALSCPDRQEAS